MTSHETSTPAPNVGRSVTIFVAGFLLLAALAGGGLYWWFNRGPIIEDIAAQTKQDVQQYFNRDLELRFITVKDVQLIQVSDHEYKGMVTVETTRVGERQVGITVTHDGKRGMWQLDRGALLPFAIPSAAP